MARNLLSSSPSQQPMAGTFHGPYSPASLHPHFSMPLQHSPIQPFFTPQLSARPTHHQGQPSMAHLAAVGIHPPNGFPITPIGGHLSRPSMMGIPGQGQPSGPPFPHRNRRQLSIGGPPKAVLGGPARRLSPLPPASGANPTAAPAKAKKLSVNLPKETILGDDGQPVSRPSWARTPSCTLEVTHPPIPTVEIATAELYPTDEWSQRMPNTLDVFLPGKVCLSIIRVAAPIFDTPFIPPARMGRFETTSNGGET